MAPFRAVLTLLAAVVVAIALGQVIGYQRLVTSHPVGAAMVGSVQDAQEVADTRHASGTWKRAQSPTEHREGLADAATLLEGRRTAIRWWAAAVTATLVWGLFLAPGAAFFRSGRALAVPVAALAGAVLTTWLEAAEGAQVRAALGGSAATPGIWRLGKLTLLLITSALHAGVVAGALRAWLEQVAAQWHRMAVALGRRFDVLFAPRSAASATPGTTAAAPALAVPRRDPSSFHALMQREWAGIVSMRQRLDGAAAKPARADDFEVVETSPADEPYVAFRSADLTGLALSGGGIRSATFNLGLLQGLHRIGLLPRVDYLSTVSGGGYIGSFWSRWLIARHLADDITPAQVRALFPGRPRGDAATHLDTEQERHLREFGRFLAPRIGLLEVETWTALVAFISGLLPALAIALALIGMGTVAWLTLTIPLAAAQPDASTITIVALTSGVFVLFEVLWQKVKLPARDQSDTRTAARRRDLAMLVAFSLAGLALVATLHRQASDVRAWWRTRAPTPVAAGATPPAACPGITSAGLPVRYVAPQWEPVCPGPRGWWRLTGLSVPASTATFLSPSLFDYSLAWLAAALVLLGVRLIHPLFPIGEDGLWVAPLDRVVMRLLGLATFWALITTLWHFALNLDRLAVSAGSAIASAGIFALLRNWIGVALQKPERPGATSRLRAVLPQALAYVTLLLTLATVGQLLIRLCGDAWPAWWMAAAVMTGTLVLGLFIDPAEFGLHAFYRARISRAYSGASNLAEQEGAAGNRQTDPKVGDDVPLNKLPLRPLHLVCCAANDLNGDDIGTLGRGARSAVLSRYGLAIGAFATPRCPPVTLGAAVTASAAAFNSNMGDVSSKLGPAVSFVMTALNLRLGLWVRHPVAQDAGARRWPGLLLYREYFGLTSASGQVVRKQVTEVLADGRTERRETYVAPTHMRDVHLSDGGHFENLAIYELVRRHCRYVLVSDCGADPTIAFDDLGRALRRIRQDFGIDIAIDVEPLRPDADGRSRQHVAVGRIHYSPTDVGVLLYVKPTLTGDELADVLQYKTRNGAFPHEGTGDQFFDEAQWESYRRLGLHVAESVFGFVPPAADPASGAPVSPTDTTATARTAPATPGRTVTADWVFGEAAARWGTTPPELEARVLQMAARVVELERDLQQSAAHRLLREVFPEFEAWTAPAVDASSPAGPARRLAEAPSGDEAAVGAVELVALLRVTQTMEDVWTACDLDTWWSHPLNMGWVNFFARWVTAPTFRFWWPLLGPMYSKGFRDFLDERFPMPGARARTPQALGVPWEGRVERVAARVPQGLAASWWSTRSAQPCPWRPRAHDVAPLAQQWPPTYYENLLTLERPGRGAVDVQVGLVSTWPMAVPAAGDGGGLTRACLWTSDDFFVPPSLWGAGIGWYFLGNLLNVLARDHARAYVIVRGSRDGAAHGVAAEDTRNFVDQYRKIGFQQRRRTADQLGLPTPSLDLLRALDFRADVDTLLDLDLRSWQSTRGHRTGAGRDVAPPGDITRPADH